MMIGIAFKKNITIFILIIKISRINIKYICNMDVWFNDISYKKD